MHYLQFYRESAGDLIKVTTHGLPLEQRILAFITKGEGCWDWKGAPPNYYGSIKVQGKMRPAHVVMYELEVGPIPDGKLLDHRCRRPQCVRPDHLRIATHKQNAENLSGANRNNNSSGVRGVTWDRRRNNWKGQVVHNRQKLYVGNFKTVADAEAAVIAKRNELFTHNDQDRKSA